MLNSLLEKPIFLIGPPRSGTTYLQMLLAEEYRVTTLPETHFFTRVPSFLCLSEGKAKLDESEFINYARDKMELEIDPIALKRVTLECEDRIPEELLKSVFEWLVRLSGDIPPGTRLLEKTPGHCMAMPLIRRLYPDAIFVAIIRHPFDTLASQITKLKDYNDGLGLLDLSRHWSMEVRTILKEARMRPDSVLVVSYDELTSDTFYTLEKIARKCGLNHRETKMSREEIHRNVALASETWKSDIIGRSKEGSGRNLLHLSFANRCLIDRFCGSEMKFLGFDSCSGLPFVAATLFRRVSSLFYKLSQRTR